MAWYAYKPGLSGGFLFDDWVNLDALGAYGPVDNGVTFWRYLTSGHADATGRPLALASFLLDARDWPADPYPFKRTSVLIHLLNGLLLALLLSRLGRILATGRAQANALRADIAAVLGAALWLLHPLFVSTTLYVVQREAMLPATFILTGLIGYVKGRNIAATGKIYGAWIAAGSIFICTVLATLSKASGALLPLLAWILDAVLLSPRAPLGPSRSALAFRRMTVLVVKIPSMALLIALAAVAAHGVLQGLPYRPWTTFERLLTQSRVVVDYLYLLWLPRPYSTGLFNDDIVASTGVLSPPSTLACMAFLALLAGSMIAFRRRWPILSFSLLFFFTAHLMESSVVPLELYFEHRNYVPAMFLLWPLAWWLANGWTALPQSSLAGMRKVLSVALPIMLSSLTFLRADLWGNSTDQALLWAERNPLSARAQAYAAQVQANRGHAADAVTRLENALRTHPYDLQLVANLADVRCQMGGINETDLHALATAIEQSRAGNSLAFTWLSRKLDELEEGKSCKGIDSSTLDRLVTAFKNGASVDAEDRIAEAHHLRGRIRLQQHDADAALTEFDAALSVAPTSSKALRQAALLADAGRPDLALMHLEKCTPSCGGLPEWKTGMAALHARLLQRQGYWETEISHLRQSINSAHD